MDDLLSNSELEQIKEAALGDDKHGNFDEYLRLRAALAEVLPRLVAHAMVKEPAAEPIAMRLPCPECGELHVDEGEFATKVHHTHACQFCGQVWRPAIVSTVGVRFLPGFNNSVDVANPEEFHRGWNACWDKHVAGRRKKEDRDA